MYCAYKSKGVDIDLLFPSILIFDKGIALCDKERCLIDTISPFLQTGKPFLLFKDVFELFDRTLVAPQPTVGETEVSC